MRSSTELLAELPPAEALAEWMNRFVSYATTKRGLSGALKSFAAADSDLIPTTRTRLLAATGELLDAGIAAGQIRSDVTPRT